MSDNTNNDNPFNYRPDHSGFQRTINNGWHEYSHVYFVSNNNFLNGADFAKAHTVLYVKFELKSFSQNFAYFPGFYNIQWFTIVDNFGRPLDPAPLSWSFSDDIQIPSNLIENDYPDLIVQVIDNVFKYRRDIKGNTHGLVGQIASQRRFSQPFGAGPQTMNLEANNA